MIISGAYREHPCKIGLENCTVLSGFWEVIRSHITFVSAPLFTLHVFVLSLVLGKMCDCKSLHWKFSNKSTCDGKPSSAYLFGQITYEL